MYQYIRNTLKATLFFSIAVSCALNAAIIPRAQTAELLSKTIAEAIIKNNPELLKKYYITYKDMMAVLGEAHTKARKEKDRAKLNTLAGILTEINIQYRHAKANSKSKDSDTLRSARELRRLKFSFDRLRSAAKATGFDFKTARYGKLHKQKRDTILGIDKYTISFTLVSNKTEFVVTLHGVSKMSSGFVLGGPVVWEGKKP